MIRLAGPLAGVLLCAAVAAAQTTPVTIYVTTPAQEQGFTDPSKERLDSLKDLRDKIRKAKKLLTLVESPEEATIILELLDREQQWKRTTAGVLFGTPWGHQRKRAITVRLRVGEFSSDFTSEKAKYSQAAGDVVNQIQRWVVANQAKLSAAK